MNPLLIFGASSRAAAFSAIRAGFEPICGDLFADADLRAFATVLDVPHYPHGLAAAAQKLPPLPWIYSGALENSPAEIDRLSERHTLWGNSSASLQHCRNPWFCRDILGQAGLPALALLSSSSPPPRDGSWLIKPLRSAAGRGIAVWNSQTPTLAEPHYFQQLASGTSIAAAFVATSGSAELLGVSEQIIGCPRLDAPLFGYCGSIFPWPALQPSVEELIRRIGQVIGRECGLRGLFGVDLISDGETAWLTEVNPRYTASMELIEHDRQLPLLDWHRRACAGISTSISQAHLPVESRKNYSGKVVRYADRVTRAPDMAAWIPRSITLAELPRLADLPVAGTAIWPGQPVFTCLGTGPEPDKLLDDLVRRSLELWSTFPELEN